MLSYMKYVMLLPLSIICIQFSCHALSLQGEQKQNECLLLGIIFTSIGIFSLVFRDFLFTIMGLILIMHGLRLIATGLDRINKNIYIDRYDEDDK